MRKHLLALGFVTFGIFAAGCGPSTQYNRGVEMSFHPSGKAEGGPRLVNSAVELKQDSDQNAIKEAGGIYLGELEVVAEKSADFQTAGGGKTLSGRVSLEAANRGATHFYLAASDTEHSVQRAQGPHVSFNGSGGEQVARTKARFVLYRVEMDKWSALPKNYQPEPAAGAAPPAAKAASGDAKPADSAAKPADSAKPSDTNAKKN